jgi:hypothetical protein
MKRIVRISERDLTRIVRRVLKENEEWSDEDESSMSDIESNAPYLSDYENTDEWESDYESWRDNPKRQDLLSKKRNIKAKKEKDRYSNVVKNRPSDFDSKKYQGEYDSVRSDIDDFWSNTSTLDQFDNADDYGSYLDKRKSDFDFDTKADRASFLRKNLDKNFKRK